MSEYLYTALADPTTHLRLISIQPGEEHEDIACEIREFSSFPIPSYQALSYVWGDSADKLPISLNGRRFLVTRNLEAALRNLRDLRFPPPWLWIDALCIDQKNSEERDEQVRGMKKIYEEAKRVIIWLGTYHEPSDNRVRESLQRWGVAILEEGSARSVRFSIELAQTLFEMDGPNSTVDPYVLAVRSWTPDEIIQAWTQLARLFHRPWFERLWIIQELTVSRTAVVRCGRVEAPYEYLERAARWIITPSSQVGQLGRNIGRILPLMGAQRVVRVSLKTTMTRDLFTVLHSTQEANCSDPRDKLYAILGIVEDAADVQIDYSMSVRQVYQNWAINRIRRTGTLDILRLCSNYNRSGDLPSWVPDLRQRWGQDTVLWMDSAGLTRNSNNDLGQTFYRRYRPKIIWSSAGVGLEVSGCKLECIKHLSTAGDAVTNLQDPAELTTRLKAITTQWELLFRNKALIPHYVDWLSIFPTQVLRVGDALSNHYEIWADWAGKQDALRQFAHNLDFSNQESQNVELNMFERHLFPRLHGCQMFITESGHPGVVAGDCNALEGDEVWTLVGDASHFLLRRTVGGYRLISPCYFHLVLNQWEHEPVGKKVERIILV
jgi:hypothetical protein